jgi:predicted branched-subunit amino acid permease
MHRRDIEPSAAPPMATGAAFWAGVKAAWTSIFALVLAGSYVGVGALAHDYGFSLGWVVVSTLLVWAAPAQVILISTLGSGAALIEAALATTLSAVRLLPMVVALLPLLRTARTRLRQLLLPAHFTAISMWIEALRLLPQVPRENRIAWCNGIGCGFLAVACAGGAAGYQLAGALPHPLPAMLLFLTPMSFLVSVVRNSRLLADRAAFLLGLLVAPLLLWSRIEFALLWTGLIGGTIGYVLGRLVGRRMRPSP